MHPKSMDEMLDLVHEAVYEIDEMKVVVEDSDPEDDWERYREVLERLDGMLRALYAEMTEGRYQAGPGQDLPFAPLIQSLGDEVPLKALLKDINDAHRSGLET